jgi:hypothetical protein
MYGAYCMKRIFVVLWGSKTNAIVMGSTCSLDMGNKRNINVGLRILVENLFMKWHFETKKRNGVGDINLKEVRNMST